MNSAGIVQEAIREAVVNALIHADHRGQGGVVIERYPFTHTTCFKVCITSTRSAWLAITVSMSL